MTREEKLQELELIEKNCLTRLKRLKDYIHKCPSNKSIRLAFVITKLAIIHHYNRTEQARLISSPERLFAVGGIRVDPNSHLLDASEYVIPNFMLQKNVCLLSARGHGKRHQLEIIDGLQKLTELLIKGSRVDEQNKGEQRAS